MLFQPFDFKTHLLIKLDRPLIVHHDGQFQTMDIMRTCPLLDLGKQFGADPLPRKSLQDPDDKIGCIAISIVITPDGR